MTATVRNVVPQRLQDIEKWPDDVQKEGFNTLDLFIEAIDKLNGKGTYRYNPWVWRVWYFNMNRACICPKLEPTPLSRTWRDQVPGESYVHAEFRCPVHGDDVPFIALWDEPSGSWVSRREEVWERMLPYVDPKDRRGEQLIQAVGGFQNNINRLADAWQ